MTAASGTAPNSHVAATAYAGRQIASARILGRSLRETNPLLPFKALATEALDERLDEASEPFEQVGMESLEIPRLRNLRFRYGPVSLSYALTPFLLRHLLEGGAGAVLFLKQESLVVGDLTPLFERLRFSSILLTPHLVAPLSGLDASRREREVMLAGTYNCGVLGVAGTSAARRFLDWWCDRLELGCRHDVAAGMHFEQRWLDLVPAFFDGVEIVRDPGANVGHWCLPERRFEVAGAEVRVDGEPARVLRFSGFDPARPDRVTRHSDRLSTEALGPGKAVFEEYRRRWVEAGGPAPPETPETFDNATAIPDIVRLVYQGLGMDVARFGDPYSTAHAGCLFDWLRAPVDEPSPGFPHVSNLWHGVWNLRSDLRHAFPEPLGSDRSLFAGWTLSTGRFEHSVPHNLAAVRSENGA